MSDDIPTREVTIELPETLLDEDLPAAYDTAVSIEEAARMAIEDGLQSRQASQQFNQRVRRFVEQSGGSDDD